MYVRLKLIQRYVLNSIIPYFCLSLLLLSVALIAQQTSRFAEIIGTARAPFEVVLDVLLYLFPSILVFTIPTATLVGTLVGYSRMNSDSELTAMRAAGTGTLSLIAPSVIFGLVLSLLTFLISFYVAPNAAREIRKIGVQAALRKLESPVEPKTFYTEMAGKVVFVREGNTQSGEWGRVFIHWQDQGKVRLVTARSGRIDTTGEQTELVLSDAEVVTLPEVNADAQTTDRQITTEHSSALRMKDERLDAGRKSLLKNLEEYQLQPEELGWRELRERLRNGVGDSKETFNIALIFHRRLALCFAPLAFAFFATVVGLRTRRGGKGIGFALSIVTLISYYLITVGAENLARAKVVPPELGSWTATCLLLLFAFLLLGGAGAGSFQLKLPRRSPETSTGAFAPALTSKLNWGLLDVYILRTLAWTFTGAMIVLTAVFQIFTLFDLLRFINNTSSSFGLISRYLFFMLPYAGAILVPMATLVAVLATFAIMARRNEAIAWWASGQSIYRLSLPGLLFAAILCIGLWQLQESILPLSNPIQNSLRAQIKGGGSHASTPTGRQWLASTDLSRIYSYAYDPGKDELVGPVVFEFDDEGLYLRRVIIASSGSWSGDQLLHLTAAHIFQRGADNIELTTTETGELVEDKEPFKPSLRNPSEMSFKQLSDYLDKSQGLDEAAAATFAVNLERKRSDPFSPLVLALIGTPMAFAFGKRNAITALSIAVALGLSFWASASGFYYLGVKGMVPPLISAWSSAAIFSAIGAYMLFRSNT